MLQGHEVTVVDNFFTGRKSNVEQWYVIMPNYQYIDFINLLISDLFSQKQNIKNCFLISHI